MATIPYTTIASKTDDSNILLSTSTVIVPTGASQTNWNNDITNLRTSATADFSSVHFANFFAGSPPRTTTLNATTLFSIDDFTDGVYHITLSSQNNTLADTYTSDCYVLITTACEAGLEFWATQKLPRQVATYNYLVDLFDQINEAYGDADYTLTDSLITQFLSVLSHPNPTVLISTLKLIDKATLEIEITTIIPNNGFTGHLDLLTNTCYPSIAPYDFSGDAFPLGVPDTTKDIASINSFTTDQYTDGAYQSYVSWIGDANSGIGVTYETTAYALVTTNIDCLLLKLIDKDPSCAPLQTQSNNLQFLRMLMQNAFDNSRWEEANKLIRKFNSLVLNSGCGCGGFQTWL